MSVWKDLERKSARRSFIVEDGAVLDIGGVRLARSRGDGAWVPDAAEFRHWVIDQPTAVLLHRLAQAIELGDSVRLVGPTGASKTSAVRYLAARLGRPVVRVNLAGHTEPADLIGRYLPTEDGWRFVEGAVTRALAEGMWLLLDELNLALPEVLERLNPVLEDVPGLVLSEHDGRVVRAHPDFRIFATMNPVDEYVGRAILSPAFLDRFAVTLWVDGGGERELVALGRRLVFGEHPAVEVAGRSYPAHAEPAPFAELRQIDGIGRFILALARLHVGLRAAAEPDGDGNRALGGGRREPYVFTRRSFLRVFRWLDQMRRCGASAPAAAWDALERYYFGRLADRKDRDTAVELAHANGLSPTSSGKESR